MIFNRKEEKMNFKEAYKEMENGKKIRRKGWDNKNSFLVLRNGENELFWNGERNEILIKALLADTLNDDWEVVEERKVWKPNLSDTYFTIRPGVTEFSCITEFYWANFPFAELNYSIGNCFQTEEEVKHIVEKLKVIKELQDFVLENNTEKIDWKNNKQLKFFINFDCYSNRVGYSCTDDCKPLPLNVFFTSRELALKAIEKVGEERIKKYYFDIDDEDCEKQKEEK